MDNLSLWYFITLLGTPEYWAAIAGLLAVLYFVLRFAAHKNPAWKRHKPGFRRFLIIFIPSLLLVFGVTLLIKGVWFVPRPCTPCSSLGTGMFPLGADISNACNPYCDSDSSFPSGHAGTVFVAFSSIYVAFRRRLAIPLFIIPLLVAYSRIALGVHTYLDVLAGALLGLALPVAVSVIVQKWHKAG